MKQRKWLCGVALLGAFALGAAACASDGGETTAGPTAGGGQNADQVCSADEFGCVEVADGAPLRLGSALVITTADAPLGLDSQHGAHLAADYRDGTFDGVNGEVLGHPIEFQDEDDQCSAEGGQAAANKLAADPTIVAVIGTSCSSAALGNADKILGDKGIMLISPSNTNRLLTLPESEGGQHNPFYARTAHNDDIQAEAVYNFISEELGLTKAATIHDESVYSEGLAGTFGDLLTAGGGTVTTAEAISSDDTDFSSLLESIAATDPEFIYMPVFIGAGGFITQQAQDVAGLDGVVLIGSDGINSTGYLEAAGDAAEGVYASGPDLNFTNPFYKDQFLPAYQEQYGEVSSVFHAHAYDAVNILLDSVESVAIEDGGTLFIPRTALRDAVLATSGYDGLTGTITCNEFGDCNAAVIAVYQVQDGAYVRMWPAS
jgi:branched-chain amino acid transport system substrate-binding protein